MIITFILSLVLNVFSFITYTFFAPLRIFFPNVINFNGDVTGIITFVANIFNSTFNFFAYFSHIATVRILFFSAVFYIFTFPIIYSGIAFSKFVVDLILRIITIIVSLKDKK